MPKATTNIVSVSLYHNLPAGDLADQLGALKAEIAGAAFGASVTQGIRWTLNTQAVKTEMGLAWYDARCRQQSVTTVSVKPLAAVAAQRVAA